MKIYTQREWRGIARKSPYDQDELTSQIEINTEPGKGELKRLGSRSQYLDDPFDAPSLRFNNTSAFLMTETSGTQNFSIFDNSTNGDEQEVQICFKFNDFESINEDFYLIDNYNFQVYYDYSETYFWLSLPNDSGGDGRQIFTTTTFKSNVWYWMHLWTDDGSTLSGTLYEDGGDTPTETDTDILDAGADKFKNSASGHPIYLCFKTTPMEIAYFYFSGATTIGTATPWNTAIAKNSTDSHSAYFLPRDLRKTIFPAQVGDSTNKVSWVLRPRPGIELSGDSFAGSPEQTNVKGISLGCGRGHILDLSGDDVFTQRTVFIFNVNCATAFTRKATLLRSFDSLFSIYMDDTNFNVRWLPDSLDSSVSSGGANVCSSALSSALSDDTWIAVEYEPDDENLSSSEPLMYLWKWNGSSWEIISWESTSYQGEGITVPSSTEWKFCQSLEPYGGWDTRYPMMVRDFRLIVGDDSWASNHEPDTALTEIPSTLRCWINLDDNNYWPKDENANTYSLSTDDYVDEILSISDRVTGRYRLHVDRYNADIQWSGCPYLTGNFYLTPNDIKTDVDGTVFGPTDGGWFTDSTVTPLISNRMPSSRKCSSVGVHKYVHGGGPLQEAIVPNSPLRFPNAMVTVADENVNNDIHPNTHPYCGELSYDTQYKFKATLYDPSTGNESNPYGPYWFDTGDYSAAASSETCSHYIQLFIETNVDISNLDVKFYRYHTATGTYRYEGSSGINMFDSTSTYAEGRFNTSDFTFTISETQLALRGGLSEDNDDPPYHIYSYIWAGRAWYVDALNKSRVRFSKQYYFSECPTSYICWTDEGASGDILGLMPGFGGLLVLKENSIWIIPQADNSAGYMAQLLIPDIGVVSADAAVFVNGALWFADNSGIYVFDGNSINQVSDKLDGLERNVWDGDPRKTRAYYDKENWKVVFVCEGTAITFDSRTGAASLCGLPDSCYGFISSSDYSGPLYGQDGMIMKEFKGNMGLALTDENYEQAGNYYGPSATFSRDSGDISDVTDITEYWTDGTNSGSEVIGYTETGIGDSTTTYLDTSSVVGSLLTQWTVDGISVTRDYDVCCNMVHISPDVNTIYMKTMPSTGLTEYYLGISPMYYKGQNIYFQTDQSEKIVELLTVLFGDWVKGIWYNFYESTGEDNIKTYEYCPTFTVDYTAETLGDEFTSNNVTTGKETFIEDRYFMRVPVQRKGFRGYYEILSTAFENIPPIKSVFIHHTALRPRGGGRR